MWVKEEVITHVETFSLLDWVNVFANETIKIGRLGFRVDTFEIDIVLPNLWLPILSLHVPLEIVEVLLVPQELNQTSTSPSTEVRYGCSYLLACSIEVDIVGVPLLGKEFSVWGMLGMVLSGFVIHKGRLIGFDWV